MPRLRLSDPKCPSDAPFRFRIGDRVAWKKGDEAPDLDSVGVVVDGVWEYWVEGGTGRVWYRVQREKDKLYYDVHPLRLRLVRL